MNIFKKNSNQELVSIYGAKICLDTVIAGLYCVFCRQIHALFKFQTKRLSIFALQQFVALTK